MTHASVWSGSAGSWVDYHPAGAESSAILDSASLLQIGYATLNGSASAGFWAATPTGWTKLPSPNTDESVAQTSIAWGSPYFAGYAAFNGSAHHAVLWDFTPPVTLVDIHPAGALESVVHEGNGNGEYVGTATFPTSPNSSREEAVMWPTPFAPHVSLHPQGMSASYAYAVSWDGQQGGAVLQSSTTRASLWSGSAASWVNLHPSSEHESIVYAARRGYQAGSTTDLNMLEHAAVWQGDAASWLDLHSFLPANYNESCATTISFSGRLLFIGGWARNSATGQREAVFWTRDACYADCAGGITLDIFDYICFGNAYNAQDPYADCDGSGALNIFDYICFGNAYAAGCP
ncbi:MAG: hypothetical protein H6815_04560 [Phycisphaeraceae bacterium]|nr:hypothetical protein [Phycisphaeraceae bacterium]